MFWLRSFVPPLWLLSPPTFLSEPSYPSKFPARGGSSMSPLTLPCTSAQRSWHGRIPLTAKGSPLSVGSHVMRLLPLQAVLIRIPAKAALSLLDPQQDRKPVKILCLDQAAECSHSKRGHSAQRCCGQVQAFSATTLLQLT